MTKLGPEILQGIIRAGDIATLGGWLNTGKSPLLKDWAVCIASGQPWCGRQTLQRPVTLIDFESRAPLFWEGNGEDLPRSGGWYDVCARRGVNPQDLDVRVFIQNGQPEDDPRTAEIDAIDSLAAPAKMEWLAGQARERPGTVFLFDPLNMLLNFDKNKETEIVALFKRFRKIEREVPGTTFVFVFNLKKTDRRVKQPNLLLYPHDWIQEVAGSLAIQNRSDVRLGLAPFVEGDNSRIILNGVRRGESMEPVILEATWHNECMSGFQQVAGAQLKPEEVLPRGMFGLWERLPDYYTLKDLKDSGQLTLAYRLQKRALTQGLAVESTPGVFEKVVKTEFPEDTDDFDESEGMHFGD